MFRARHDGAAVVTTSQRGRIAASKALGLMTRKRRGGNYRMAVNIGGWKDRESAASRVIAIVRHVRLDLEHSKVRFTIVAERLPMFESSRGASAAAEMLSRLYWTAWRMHRGIKKCSRCFPGGTGDCRPSTGGRRTFMPGQT